MIEATERRQVATDGTSRRLTSQDNRRGKASAVRAIAVTDSAAMPAWAAWVVDALERKYGWQLDCAYINTGKTGPQPGIARRAMAYLDGLKFNVATSAHQPSADTRHQAMATLTEITAKQPPQQWDHCIYLGQATPPAGLAQLSGNGVVFPRFGSRGQQGWEDFPLQEPAVVIELVRMDTAGREQTLYRASAEADVRSVVRTENRALWTAATLLKPSIIQQRHSTPAADTDQPERAVSAAGVTSVLKVAAATGRRVVKKRRRRRLGEECWFIELTPRSGGRTQLLTPPPGTNFADPVVHRMDGATYLFFEAFEHNGKGRILVCEIGADGSLSAPQEALRADYHLSYPFAFTWQDRHFMIPESSENGTLDLWESDGSATSWRKRQTLLEGLEAVDATLFQTGAGWWMFTSVREHSATSYSDNLHLYFAESPLGPWQAHPANPVKFNVRSSRCAGPLYTHNGSLMRPAQDCRRRYGAGIVLNRIEQLTFTEFTETPVQAIAPAGKGEDGLHTFCVTHDWIASDRRSRIPPSNTHAARFDPQGNPAPQNALERVRIKTL